MKISHRLYLTMMPAVLGLLLLAALSYWGQYERTAPTLVLVAGVVAAVASLALTWSNARYVAGRINRLATTMPSAARDGASTMAPQAHDEIEQIEQVVGRLSSAVDVATATDAERERRIAQRTRDYAALLASIADSALQRVEEVRLPLHILLENRFGDLNENQEEMLGAAREATDAVDADLLALREIAALDSGTRPLRRDRMRISEVLEALRPLLMAAAETAGVTLELDVAPLLPPVVGDRPRLQQALTTILRGAIEGAPRGARVGIRAEREGALDSITVRGTVPVPMTVRAAAATRLVQAHGGSVEQRDGVLAIALPTGA